MSIEKAPISKSASRQQCVPWRINIHQELDQDQLMAVAAVFLDGADDQYVIAADVYPGITQIVGDYWMDARQRRTLTPVQKRWATVQERFPELITDAVLEYRLPAALLDQEPFNVTEVNPALGLPPE